MVCVQHPRRVVLEAIHSDMRANVVTKLKHDFVSFAVGWKAETFPGYKAPASRYFQSFNARRLLYAPPALTLKTVNFTGAV